MPSQNRLHIHHRQAFYVESRNHFECAAQRLNFRRDLTLRGAHHHILSPLLAPSPFVEHAKRFAHTRSVSKEHLQSSRRHLSVFCVLHSPPIVTLTLLFLDERRQLFRRPFG